MKPVKVGINGFGRIGRLFLRLVFKATEKGRIDVVHINDPCLDASEAVHLLRHDTVYGPCEGVFEAILLKGPNDAEVHWIRLRALSGTDDEAVEIRFTQHKDAAAIEWDESEVDYVLECSGHNLTQETAKKHLHSSLLPSKVILSAPPKDPSIPVFCIGVNTDTYVPGTSILSNASCTTNCIAPIAKILHDKFGIESALMTSIHAATASQKVVDGSSGKGKSLTIGRCTLDNIIPTSTGAAQMCARVIPGLEDKITGMALRVPVSNVSTMDLSVNLINSTSLPDIFSAIEEASKTGGDGDFEAIVCVEREPTVSSDWRGSLMSAVVDAPSCIELTPNFFKILAFYDNEMGYAARLVDMVCYIHAQECAYEKGISKFT